MHPATASKTVFNATHLKEFVVLCDAPNNTIPVHGDFFSSFCEVSIIILTKDLYLDINVFVMIVTSTSVGILFLYRIFVSQLLKSLFLNFDIK